MKITMYELLGMIKDDKAPKKIKYAGYEYSWHGERYGYYRSVILSNWIALTTDFSLLEILNDDVEILEEEPRDIEVCGSLFTKSEYDKLAHSEEEKKIPEKLIPTSLKGIDNLDEKIEIAHIDTISVIETVNQVIDYLKSKGE